MEHVVSSSNEMEQNGTGEVVILESVTVDQVMEDNTHLSALEDKNVIEKINDVDVQSSEGVSIDVKVEAIRSSNATEIAAAIDLEVGSEDSVTLSNPKEDEDEDDEDNNHQRFLRTKTEENLVTTDARSIIAARKSFRYKSSDVANGIQQSSSALGDEGSYSTGARLVLRNLPPNCTAQHITSLLQVKLPDGVELLKCIVVQEGRAEVQVMPDSAADDAVRILHNTMVQDNKICVRKLITANARLGGDAGRVVGTGVALKQNVCSRVGCILLVYRGDDHPMCSVHSPCLTSNLFDPSSCTYCSAIYKNMLNGDPTARKLWNNRTQKMRRKGMRWISDDIKLKFNGHASSRNASITDTGRLESMNSRLQPAEQATEEEVVIIKESTPGAGAVEDSDPAVASQQQPNDDVAVVEDADVLVVTEEESIEDKELEEQYSSLILNSKNDLMSKSKGEQYRARLKSLPFGYKPCAVIKLLQDIVGDVSFVLPQRGLMIVEFNTTEAVSKCYEEMNKMVFMKRSIFVQMQHTDRNQNKSSDASTSQQGVASKGPMGGSVSDNKTPSTTALPQLSAQMMGRLTQDNNTAAQPTKLTKPVQSTGGHTSNIKDRLENPQVVAVKVQHKSPVASSNPNTFGFSPELLKSLNITLPIVKEIFVKNVVETATDKDVKELFSVAGPVLAVHFGPNKGQAIVEMGHPVDAVQAISMLHSQFYFDKALQVELRRQPSRRGNPVKTIPKGLQTIGKRVPVDKSVMASYNLAAKGRGTSTPGSGQQQLPAVGGAKLGVNRAARQQAQQYPNRPLNKNKANPPLLVAPNLPNTAQHANKMQGGNMTPNAMNTRLGKRLRTNDNQDANANNKKPRTKRKNPYWGDYKGQPSMGSSNMSTMNTYAGNNNNNRASANNPGANFTNYNSNYSGTSMMGAGNGSNSYNSNYSDKNNSGQSGNYGGGNSRSGNYNSGPHAPNSGASFNSNGPNSGASYSGFDYSNLSNYGNSGNYGQYSGGETSSVTGTNNTPSTNNANWTSSAAAANNWNSYGSTGNWNNSSGGEAATNSNWQNSGQPNNANTSGNHSVGYGGYNEGTHHGGQQSGGGSVGNAYSHTASDGMQGYAGTGISSNYGYGTDGSNSYGGGGHVAQAANSRSADDSLATRAKDWAAQPTSKMPKYNADGSFGGFSFITP